jgi:hypothetical protein
MAREVFIHRAHDAVNRGLELCNSITLSNREQPVAATDLSADGWKLHCVNAPDDACGEAVRAYVCDSIRSNLNPRVPAVKEQAFRRCHILESVNRASPPFRLKLSFSFGATPLND